MTRPEAASDRFAALWRERHGGSAPVLIAPVVEIRNRPIGVDAATYAALIFTSANGVAALGRAGRPSRAWCVGPRSAEAASAAGLEAFAADGDVESLIAARLASKESGPLLHLRGREARGDLAARLTAAGVACDEAVVYEQADLPLADTARALLARPAPVLLPLFSPNSAARLSAALADCPVAATLLVAAMSRAVAEAWSGPEPDLIKIAARPEATAMLEALETILEVSLRR